MRDLETILNETYQNLGLFVRDLNLSTDLFNLYKENSIITEPSFVDMTYKVGGINPIHNTRFIILSSRARDFQELEEGTSWGLHIINTNAYYKVLSTHTLNDVSMIILLHIKKEDVSFFKDNEVSIDSSLIDNVKVEMRSALNKGVLPEIDSDLWYRRVNFPIGLKEDGTFFKENEKLEKKKI